MELLAQLLLESRIGAYIEWLGNELIITGNNKHTLGFTISVAFHKKETHQTTKPIISLGVGKLFLLVG